jgi:hypothetical protein
MHDRPKGSPRAAFSISGDSALAPLPGLAASAASRLPLWLLITLALAYIGHGLFGRGPWRGDDLIGIALARSTAEALFMGDWRAVLLPQMEGVSWNASGPLWAAILGAFALPVVAWAAWLGQALPAGLVDDAARLASGICMLLGLMALWRATDRFARRREAQPLDPLGVGPNSRDFGRTLADCAILLCVATLGVIHPWHQAGPAAVGFLLQGLLLWSLATAPETPHRAGRQCGLVGAAALLAIGPGHLIAITASLILIMMLVKPYRMVAREFISQFVPVTLLIIAVWMSIAAWSYSPDRVTAWWSDQMTHWGLSRWIGLESGGFENIQQWIAESLWRWWPLWPIAAFGIWRAGRAHRLMAPHWAVPLLICLTLIAAGLLGPSGWRTHQSLPVAGLAMTAAFGLLSLPRPLINLIDWFAVTLFSSLGIFIWLYWSALNFGLPQALAVRVEILAPGVTGNANTAEILVGIMASLAWIALVLWRVRRGQPRLWRPVVLSAGGLTLLWILMMTLWMPAIDRMLSPQTLALSLENGWLRAAETRSGIAATRLKATMASSPIRPDQLPAGRGDACVRLAQDSPTLNAIAISLTGLPLSESSDCAWRLALAGPDLRRMTVDDHAVGSTRWKVVWQSRAYEDRRSGERFVLLERIP